MKIAKAAAIPVALIIVALIGTQVVIYINDRYGSVGIASWYGSEFSGKKTASGERFNPDKMTAAHKVLPFGTRVRVTNLSNDRQVVVTINDRGPFIRGRIIDLSRGAARRLDMIEDGIAKVKIEVLSDKK